MSISDERPASVRPRCLLAWWGSLERGGETVGDLRATERVMGLARSAGFDVRIASIVPYAELSTGHIVDWTVLDPSSVDLLLFVCGPIIGDSLSFRALVTRFERCLKVAVGVSMLPVGSASSWNPFDALIARDGTEPSYGDLAGFRCSKPARLSSTPRLGLCLRGEQREYGADASLHAEAAELAQAAAQACRAEVIPLDTRLQGGILQARRIETSFEQVDLVVTTRLHAALLALSMGKPTLVIDQVRGGAKVRSVVSRLGWPALIGADAPGGELNRHLAWLRSDNALPAIVATQASAAKQLAAAEQAINRILLSCTRTIYARQAETRHP